MRYSIDNQFSSIAIGAFTDPETLDHVYRQADIVPTYDQAEIIRVQNIYKKVVVIGSVALGWDVPPRLQLESLKRTDQDELLIGPLITKDRTLLPGIRLFLPQVGIANEQTASVGLPDEVYYFQTRKSLYGNTERLPGRAAA